MQKELKEAYEEQIQEIFAQKLVQDGPRGEQGLGNRALSTDELYQLDSLKKSIRMPAPKLQELVLAAQAGSEEAKLKLCHAYRPLVRRLVQRNEIYKVLGPEDAKQSCYLYILEVFLSYKGSRWDTLPGLVAIYTMRKLYRDFNRAVRFVNNNVEHDLENYTDLVAELNLEEQARLKQAVARLPQLEQEILRLHFAEDLSYDQVAKRLGYHRSSIFRIRKMILEHLRQIYG